MGERQRLVSDTMWTGLDWILVAIGGYLFWTFMGKLLIPQDYGIMVTVLTLYSLLVTILGLSTIETFIKFVPAVRTELNTFITKFGLYLFPLTLAVAFVLQMIPESLSQLAYGNTQMAEGFQILGLLLIFGFAYNAGKGVLYGIRRYSRIVLTDALFSVTKLIGAVILVSAGIKLGWSWAWIAGLGAAGLLALFLSGFWPSLKGKTVKMKEIANYGLASLFSVPSAWFFYQSQPVFVGMILGLQAAGLFGVMVIFSGILSVIPGIMYTVFLPAAAQFSASNKRENLQKLLDNVVRYLMILQFPLFVVLSAFRVWFIKLFYTASYMPAEVIILPALFGLSLVSFVVFYGGLLAIIGRPWIRVLAFSIGAVVNIAVILFTVPVMGIIGAAMGLLLGSVLSFAVSAVILRRHGFSSGWPGWRVILALAIFAFSCWFTSGLTTNFALQGAILATTPFVYFVILKALRILNQEDYEIVQNLPEVPGKSLLLKAAKLICS